MYSLKKTPTEISGRSHPYNVDMLFIHLTFVDVCSKSIETYLSTLIFNSFIDFKKTYEKANSTLCS